MRVNFYIYQVTIKKPPLGLKYDGRSKIGIFSCILYVGA